MAGYMYLGSKKVCPVIEYVPFGFPVGAFMGYVDSNGKLQKYDDSGYTKDIVLSGFTDVGDEVLFFLFGSVNISSNNVILKDLIKVSGDYALAYFLDGCKFKNFSAPLLEEITGDESFELFCRDSDVEVLLFPKLSRLYGSEVFFGCLYDCKKVKDVYFNSLTSTSFGSNTNQFYRLCKATTASESGTCTIHFPSNLESTISGLNGYPNFGGENGRIVLAYDLPATE